MDTEAKCDPSAQSGCETVPLSRIDGPGVYVTQRGDMLRIASDYMARGWSAALAAGSLGRLTRLSEDPCESVSECRRRASLADLRFNF